MRPHIVVISTGGTIAMRYDPQKKGDVSALTGGELVSVVPSLSDIASLEVVEFSNIPSFHISPEIMLRLARETESIRNRADVAGIVITHGTDTLEETAFFLDLYLPPGKPVCVTGAMRTGDHCAPDGPYNILSAVKTASTPVFANAGVLVVMNGEVHAARYVTKMHTSSVETFTSPFWGPLGHVDGGTVLARPCLRQTAPLRPEKLPRAVPILKVYTGMDSELLDAIALMRPEGLVLEGYGRGNFPAVILPALRKMLADDVVIVAASRVPIGRTLGIYAAEGGGAQLRSLGVLCSGTLNSQKARIKLMLALGVSRDMEMIAGCFREDEETAD